MDSKRLRLTQPTRGRAGRQKGDTLIGVTLALAALVAIVSTSRLQPGGVQAALLTLLEAHAAADETFVFVNELQKLGMP